jgi:hypothetical protein
MVEGKDIGLLKAFQDLLFSQSPQPIDTIPSMPIGGWGGWPYAVGSAMLLRNAMDEAITSYCILDSDYHTTEEIDERRHQAAERNVELHIWSMKEIENFLLVPGLIQRAISRTLPARVASPTEEEVRDVLLGIVNGFREEVLDGLATEILARDRKLALATANKQARDRLEGVVKKNGSFARLAPGKAVISKLSDWSQRQFGVQLNPLKLARNAYRDEIDEEVVDVLSAIETTQTFNKHKQAANNG